MGGTMVWLSFLLFFAFALQAQAGPYCNDVCQVKHSGRSCKALPPGLMMIILDLSYQMPCATCNTTGQTNEVPLGCLPNTLKMMQVTEYSDSSGRLRSFPRLNKLLTLILGPGSMQATGSETFSAVPNLQALSMSSNAIKVIGSWFGGITKLVKLDLSRNEIDHIMKNALQPLARLEYLILMYNRLSTVEDWYFAGLTNLKYLHLSYNNISHIAAKSFDYLSTLRSLSLHHNKLLSVNASWLKRLPRPGRLAQYVHFNLAYNLIRTISVESLAIVRGWRHQVSIDVTENPFRCTCALDGLKSVGPRALGRVYSRLQCSYPPSLSGRKIADVERYEMPCPPPTATAKVSRQDDGATLVCEVFWEKQPEIRWLDPDGRDVREGESADHCFSAVTVHLEHEVPTTQSPEGGTAHSTSDSGLPYIGKSTSTLRLSQKAYRCWTEGSFRCIVQSTQDSVTVDLPLTKPRETSEEGQSLQHTVTVDLQLTKPRETTEGGQSLQHTVTVDLPLTKPRETSIGELREEHTTRAVVYATTPIKWKREIIETIAKTTDKNTMMTVIYATTPIMRNRKSIKTIAKTKNLQWDGTTSTGNELQQETMMTVVYATTPIKQNRKFIETIAKTTDRNRQQDSTTPTGNELHQDTMMTVYSTSACVASILLVGITFACAKCYKRRQHQHYNVQGNAAGANGGIPLQNIQPPAPGSPAPGISSSLHHTYDEIQDDTPIVPYAETTQLKNPVYGADVTGPKGATSIPDPRSHPGGPLNSRAVSQPPGLGTSQAGKVPDPPPRSNILANCSDSNYYPPGMKTNQAEEIPYSLPRTDRCTNSNASSQPQDREMSEQMPPPAAGTSPGLHGSGMDKEEEVAGPNIYLDLNGPPRLPGP